MENRSLSRSPHAKDICFYRTVVHGLLFEEAECVVRLEDRAPTKLGVALVFHPRRPIGLAQVRALFLPHILLQLALAVTLSRILEAKLPFPATDNYLPFHRQ